MKRFSEYFSDYITGKKLTWKEAANLCGVDRTLLSRYASGKKLPDSLEKVSKIAAGLGMSVQQAEELRILYQASKMGEYQYRVLNLIEQIFCGEAICPGKDLGFGNPKWKCKKEATQRLDSREEVRGAILWFAQEASYLRIHMNFCGMLSGIRFSCKTEQIVEMGHTGSREEEVEEFKEMLPQLYFGQDYKIYCHYTRHRETAGLEERISMLLSDKGLILFSEASGRGICTCEAGYRDYYGQKFSEDLKKCHVFGGSGCVPLEEGKLQGGDIFLEHASSGVSFLYRQQCGRIWVQKSGNGQRGFYVEEAQLVKMFLIFMEMQKDKKAVLESVWEL